MSVSGSVCCHLSPRQLWNTSIPAESISAETSISWPLGGESLTFLTYTIATQEVRELSGLTGTNRMEYQPEGIGAHGEPHLSSVAHHASTVTLPTAYKRTATTGAIKAAAKPNSAPIAAAMM